METFDKEDSPFRRHLAGVLEVRHLTPQDEVLLAVVVTLPVVAAVTGRGEWILLLVLILVLYNLAGGSDAK